MRSRLPDLPVLRSTDTEIRAEHFNCIRLGLIRLENPLRLVLPGLRGLDMLLDRESWVCIDRTLNDLPVLAWTEFRTPARGLHEPISCRVLHFHAYANVILRTALEDVYRIVGERLRRAEYPAEGGVLHLEDYRRRA